jgi:hypothetical protein
MVSPDLMLTQWDCQSSIALSHDFSDYSQVQSQVQTYNPAQSGDHSSSKGLISRIQDFDSIHRTY